MGTSSLLRLLVPGLLAACSPPPIGGSDWGFSDGMWSSDAVVVPGDQLNGALPAGLTRVRISMDSDVPARVAAELMTLALEHGATGFDLRIPGDDTVRSVGLPPARSAASSFAVVSVLPEGISVSAPGGAELAVPCGPCASSQDWSLVGVSQALEDSGTTMVLVAFSPEVPWGAVCAGVDSAEGRPVRIARRL